MASVVEDVLGQSLPISGSYVERLSCLVTFEADNKSEFALAFCR